MKQSNFTTNFSILNRCKGDIKKWHFEEGMCFGDQKKWWVNDGSSRETRYEGVDFCSYVQQNGTLVFLNQNTKIPLLFDGYVAEIFDDFVGRSVLVRHSGKDTRQLCSVYAHIVPEKLLKVGAYLKAGKCLGRCAQGKTVPTHFHLSVIRLLPSEEAQDWFFMIKKYTKHFIDPIQYIT